MAVNLNVGLGSRYSQALGGGLRSEGQEDAGEGVAGNQYSQGSSAFSGSGDLDASSLAARSLAGQGPVALEQEVYGEREASSSTLREMGLQAVNRLHDELEASAVAIRPEMPSDASLTHGRRTEREFGNAIGESLAAESWPKLNSAQDVAARKAAPDPYGIGQMTPQPDQDGVSIGVANGVTVYDNGNSPQAIGARDGDILAANGTGQRKSSTGQRLPMVPRELMALRDPAVLADPAKLRSLYNAALDNSRAWLPASLSPEETSLTTGVAYHKVFGEDRTAIWFGLAPYATSKVGETYNMLDKFRVDLMDRADAGIIRQGFSEGNRAIFESMFTAEQFYQAGGAEAIRAMVNLDSKSFGAGWTQRNADYANSLVESFELRDQAKAAFVAGQSGKGEVLLGQSLQASADFEQRVVLQQYYDKSYTATTLMGNAEARTLRQAIQGVADLGPRAIAEYVAERLSTVTINGQSLSFTGRDVGDVSQRMPFVYSLAGNLMNTYSGDGNWLSGSQRIYQDQFNVLQRTYGADAMFSVRRRLGF